MNYIFTMTVSGTGIYLAYMLIRRIVGDRLAEKWYYMLLNATVVYFLIPLPFLKQFYMWVLPVTVNQKPNDTTILLLYLQFCPVHKFL